MFDTFEFQDDQIVRDQVECDNRNPDSRLCRLREEVLVVETEYYEGSMRGIGTLHRPIPEGPDQGRDELR